jgi:hypothetical protein
MSSELLVVGHTGATVAMVGVMWAVQLVIYPQFRRVDPGELASFLGDHSRRIVSVLVLFAPLEVLFSLLLWLDPPDGISRWVAFCSGLVLAALWVATGAYYGPSHGRIAAAPATEAPALVERLISTNWLRTAGWTLRGGVALYLLWEVLEQRPT